MMEFLQSTDMWSIIVKVLGTTAVTALTGLICTLMGKLIANWKDSKIRKHAAIAVKAAEQKFPNEGTKMGPEKMAYVMDYLAITFPKIKSNQYLYNIAEAAVYELNNQNIKKDAQQAFKDKYGELPDEITSSDNNTNIEENMDSDINESKDVTVTENIEETVTSNSVEFTLKSF